MANSKQHLEDAALRAAHQAGLRYETRACLSSHTSFNIGGPASVLAEAHSVDELCRGLRATHDLAVPVLVLGGGTNLLVSDDGWQGLALRLRLDEMHVCPEAHRVRVQASVQSHAVVEATVSAGLGGLEFAAGLPGTIGGAIAGNAGCFGGTLGERLVSALVVDASGAVHRIEGPAWFDFAYRSSRLLSGQFVLAEAELKVEPGDALALRARADELVAFRRERHPWPDVKTAGSFFKNLPPLEPGGMRRAAGALLDAVGAKAMAIGDAAVFERHANIIVNRGHATAVDVLRLADRMASAVLASFGVQLEPEVRFVGELPALTP